MNRSYASTKFSLCPFPQVLFAMYSLTSSGSFVLQFFFRCLNSLATFLIVDSS